jgi:hypothetical protein
VGFGINGIIFDPEKKKLLIMKYQLLKALALFSFSFVIVSCDEVPPDPKINDETEDEVLTFAIENFVSSFEQIVSGPYSWYWEFDHTYSGDKIISTDVNQALLGEFGLKSVLKYSHTTDINGNIQYTAIEEGPISNGGKYYVYDLDEEGYIKSVDVKDAPDGKNIKRWTYTYDDDRNIVSKDEKKTFSSSGNNTQTFTYDGSGNITKWKIEKEVDNSVQENQFDFNDQGQVISILGFNDQSTEIYYNNSGYISQIKEARQNSDYLFNFEYLAEMLAFYSYRNELARSVHNYGKNMGFVKSKSFHYKKPNQNEEGDLLFVIEDSPKQGDRDVIRETYFAVEENGNLRKGISEYNLGFDLYGHLTINEKRFYDLDGHLIYKYSIEGNGGIWFDQNDAKIDDFTKIPDWVKNLANSNSTFSNSISLFNAKTYNILSY